MTQEPRYALHRRTELDASDLDDPRGELIEVVVRWGSQVLHVRHLRDGDRFVASTDPDDRGADLFVDGSALFGEGRASASNSWVCIHRERGAWRLCPAPVTEQPSAELGHDEVASLALGALELRVRRVSAARPALKGHKRDRAMMGALLASSIAVSALAGVTWIEHQSFNPMLSDEGTHLREQWISHMVARTVRAQDAVGNDARGSRGEENQPAPGAANERPSAARPKVRRVLGSAEGRVQQQTLARTGGPSRGVIAALGAFRGSQFDTAFDALRAPTDSVLGGSGQSSVGATVADAFGYGGLGGGVASHGANEFLFACGCGGGTIGVRAMENFGLGVGAYGERFSTVASAGQALRERATRGPMVRTARGPRVCGASRGEVPSCSEGSSDGFYPADAVRRVVQRNIGQIQHCFEQAISRDPSTHGRVEVRFVIGSNGAVLGSTVDSNNTGDEQLGRCASDAFRRWTFPAPSSVVTVNYPLSMQSM